ncbi:daptide-type RiPP biosynthesis methyltransferase [Nonomuraea sp. NPDC002799]
MTQKPPAIPGTASQIVELFGTEIIRDVYGPEAAKLYDIVNRHDRVEIEELLSAAAGVTSPILELGCGTGRLTVPFLERGHDMVALDLSPDMLSVFADRLREPQSQAYAGKAELVEADMAEFHLDRKFDLIVAGGSAVLTIDAERRAALFRNVREHLAEGGRFLVTFIGFEFLDEDPSSVESISVFTLADEISPLMCTLFDYISPTEGIRSSSFLTHRIKNSVITDTKLYNGMTFWVSPAQMEQEIEEAGLRITARQEISTDPGGASPLRAHVRQRRPLLEVTR